MAKKGASKATKSKTVKKCDPPPNPPTLVSEWFPNLAQEVVYRDWQEGEHELLGFLQLCIERRFHRAIQAVFEEKTGLDSHDYWKHSDFGGTPKMDAEDNRAQYAYGNGATIMGWSAHGSECGAFKEPLHPHKADDDEISVSLASTLYKKVLQYPKAAHYGFFATYTQDCRIAVYVFGPLTSSDTETQRGSKAEVVRS